MELKIDRPVRLDQLQAELRSVLGPARLSGLSAYFPSDCDGTVLVLHLDGPDLSSEEAPVVMQAIAAHVPDDMWGSDQDERTLWSLLERPASPSSVELEAAFRALVRLLRIEKPTFT